MVVAEYMTCLDSDDPLTALEFMEPDVEFRIVLPEREVAGNSRADWGDYIGGRTVVGRIHHIMRSTVDRDVELLYGLVTENGEPMGVFLSSANISPRNKIQRYLAFFHTSYRLLDWPEDAD